METPPSPAAAAATALHVGRWRVDAAADEIESDGRVVKLEPLQMRLLLCLVERAGQVVLTQDLLDRVWGDLIVTPNSVYQAVAQLRRQLGGTGDGEESLYIQTLHRKGYRLVAQVRRADVSAPAPSATEREATTAVVPPTPLPPTPLPPTPLPPTPLPPNTRSNSVTPRRAVLATAAVAAAAAVAWVAFRSTSRGREGPPRLAVLPFVDTSDGRTEQALARGLAQDIVRTLGRYADLQVLAPDSVQEDVPVDSDERVGEVARKLDAQVVLLGRLGRSGSAVRLNVRAVRLPAQRTLFEREFRAPIESAADLPAQVARETAGALGLAAPAQPVIAADASQAYELFVLGNDAWQPRTPEAFAKARLYFQRGIDLDPAYARNYVGLGWTWIGQATNGAGIELPRAMALATPLFDRALRLQPDLAEALSAQATLHTFAGEFDTARKLLERALVIQPNYVQAHHSLGVVEFDSGWPLRAVQHFERAAQLNPLNATPLDRLALAQLFAGHAPAAAVSARKAVSLKPQHPNGHWSLGIAGYASGDLTLAVRSYRQALELEVRRPYLWYELARLYLDLELPDQAAGAFARTIEQLPGAAWAPVHAALAWLARRERGSTPPALERVPEGGHAIELTLIRAMAGLPLDGAALKRSIDAATARGENLSSEPWFLFQGSNRRLDLATVLVTLGDRDAAEPHLAAANEQLARLEKQGNRWHTLKFHQARGLALLGSKGPALDALDAGAAAGCRRGWWLELDPAFAGLRTEPRFAALRARIGDIVAQQRRQLGF